MFRIRFHLKRVAAVACALVIFTGSLMLPAYADVAFDSYARSALALVPSDPLSRVCVYDDNTMTTAPFIVGTVGKLLDALGTPLGEYDRVSPSADTPLAPGMDITVTRARTYTSTVEEIVPCAVTLIPNEYLPRGEEIIHAEGADGTRVVTYETVTCGGILISRTPVEVAVTAASTERIVEYGPGGTIVTDDGKTLSWSHKIDGTATAYTTEGYRIKNNALGRVARPGTIAVDPKVIPLKSVVFVESPSGAWVYGEAVAEDTGGAIKGTIIDLYFNTRAECFQFGRRSCVIYIIEPEV